MQTRPFFGVTGWPSQTLTPLICAKVESALNESLNDSLVRETESSFPAQASLKLFAFAHCNSGTNAVCDGFGGAKSPYPFCVESTSSASASKNVQGIFRSGAFRRPRRYFNCTLSFKTIGDLRSHRRRAGPTRRARDWNILLQTQTVCNNQIEIVFITIAAGPGRAEFRPFFSPRTSRNGPGIMFQAVSGLRNAMGRHAKPGLMELASEPAMARRSNPVGIRKWPEGRAGRGHQGGIPWSYEKQKTRRMAQPQSKSPWQPPEHRRPPVLLSRG